MVNGEVVSALIGFGGGISVAFITWIINYFLEIQKAKLQKEHTKFTSYHAKQVDVLSEVYRRISQVVRGIDRVLNINDQESESEVQEELIRQSIKELEQYFQDNIVFIDQISESQITKLLLKLEETFIYKLILEVKYRRPEDEEILRQKLQTLSASSKSLMDDIKDRVRLIFSE